MLGSEMDGERRGEVREAACSQSGEEGRDLRLWKVSRFVSFAFVPLSRNMGGDVGQNCWLC